MKSIIRPYSPADRETVRHICCETGFSGDPIDPLFCDRDVFADFFTRYYTDWEPENSFVSETDGQVTGYLLGCLRCRYNQFVNIGLFAGVIAPKAAARLFMGRYDAQSRAFLKWCVLKGWKETPQAPPMAGHFHFNLLPEYRNTGAGKRMYLEFEKLASQQGVKRIYGQIQTFDDRRSERVFQRFGFTLLDRREISRFRSFHDRAVYVSTFVKELQ
ncbi:MAG: GNAT family N-acetyltransferase [Candidatus Omnitrophota bacterium]